MTKLTDSTIPIQFEHEFRQFDVLTTFALLSEPLRPHIEALRSILAEANGYDLLSVPRDVHAALLHRGRAIVALTGIEGLSYALAAVEAAAGARAAEHEWLLRSAWTDHLPGWGSPGMVFEDVEARLAARAGGASA